MPTRPAGRFPLPDVRSETWILRYDEGGACTSPRTREALLNRLRESPNGSILLLAHGWNNDFGDAVSLYGRFLREFEALADDAPELPLVIGVTWPSIWFPPNDGPRLAAVVEPDEVAAESVMRALRDALPPGTDRERLYTLLDSEALSMEQGRELANLLKPALRASGEGAEESGASEESIFKTLCDCQIAFGAPVAPSDPERFGTVDDGFDAPAQAGLLDYLDSRWALRLASVYLMKDRAGLVGRKGVAPLLREILAIGQGAVYAVGHSFGGKVVLSAATAPGALGRKLAGLLLLQPAISHLSFAETVPGRAGPGGYRSVLDRVEGPIFTTYSASDFPLHDLYHRLIMRRGDLGEIAEAGAGEPPSPYAALGGYGPRGASEHLVDPIPGPNSGVDVPPGVRLVGLDGSAGKRIGGHGDVANPYTAWALCELMRNSSGARR